MHAHQRRDTEHPVRICQRQFSGFLLPEVLGLPVEAIGIGLQELGQFQGANSAEKTGNNDGRMSA
jgi:hypothetical protein